MCVHIRTNAFYIVYTGKLVSENLSGGFFEEASSAPLLQLLNISADSSTSSSTKDYLEVTSCVLCVSPPPRVCPLAPVLSQGVRKRQRPELQSQVSDQWGVK